MAKKTTQRALPSDDMPQRDPELEESVAALAKCDDELTANTEARKQMNQDRKAAYETLKSLMLESKCDVYKCFDSLLVARCVARDADVKVAEEEPVEQ